MRTTQVMYGKESTVTDRLRFGYDANSNMTSFGFDGQGLTTISYDDLDRAPLAKRTWSNSTGGLQKSTNLNRLAFT